MPTYCFVPMCKGAGVHRFPLQDAERCKEWIQNVRRADKKPNDKSRICRAHFKEEDYEKDEFGLKVRKILRDTAVPTIFPWSKATTLEQEKRSQRATKRKLYDDKEILVSDSDSVLAEPDIYCIQEEVEVATEIEPMCEPVQEPHLGLDQCTQTDSTPLILKQSKCTQTKKQLFSVHDFATDPEGFHFYTGLECMAKFTLLLHITGPLDNIKYYRGFKPSIGTEDQLFLTLIRLRRYTAYFELSRWFGMTQNGIANVFITWINILNQTFESINWWPERDMVKFFMPHDFKMKYPATRVTLDGTEVPMQKPGNPSLQQATFSTYKNRNTLKTVVGTSPGGVVTYLSDVYGGSTSDRQIIERSDILNKMIPNDSIMVDKGFNIEDLLIPYNLTLNIPSFFKKKNKIDADTVLKDRKVASKRVHVERLIGIGKTFKILQQPLTPSESSLGQEIVHVCFYLCNFRTTIVNENA